MSACSNIITIVTDAVRRRDFSGFDKDSGYKKYVISTGYAVMEFQRDAEDEVYVDMGIRWYIEDAFSTSDHSFMLKTHNKMHVNVMLSEE